MIDAFAKAYRLLRWTWVFLVKLFAARRDAGAQVVVFLIASQGEVVGICGMSQGQEADKVDRR